MSITKALACYEEILDAYVQVIDNTVSECVIVTPYYQSIQEIEEAIARAERRNVKIMVYGRAEKWEEKQDDQEYDFSPLKQFRNIQYEFIPYLHAKAIRNENELVISSMNFTESSVRQENIELGIYTTDKNIIKNFERKNQPLRIRHSKLNLFQQTRRADFTNNTYGYCIRCKRKIDFNPNAPFCYDCYQKWNYYGREGYHPERYCHECGRNYDEIFFAKPLCHSCYFKR